MKDAFRLLLRVRYGECDAQQVVFNARYADYADLAATEYVRALFGSYQNLLARGVDNQVVRLAIDWKSPARFDEVLAISVVTSHVGNTSYSLQLEFQDFPSRRLVAVAEIVYVMVSAQGLEKMAIPDDLRQTLSAGATGIVVNQAGIEY